jgi:hypothetical protein
MRSRNEPPSAWSSATLNDQFFDIHANHPKPDAKHIASALSGKALLMRGGTRAGPQYRSLFTQEDIPA